jgi:hypothetical protein
VLELASVAAEACAASFPMLQDHPLVRALFEAHAGFDRPTLAIMEKAL